MPPARLLLIDNHDSYTYNLAHLLTAANHNTPPKVLPANAYPTLHALTAAHGTFDGHILSPGPGTPHNPTDFPPLERALLSAATPLLGVCLGHQALCLAHGAPVTRSPAGPVHGAVSVLTRAPAGHDCPLLRGLPPRFAAVRYHSLAVRHERLRPQLLPTAWACDVGSDGAEHPVLMAVRHRYRPLFGVQFHPESVATDHGLLLAANFVHVVNVCKSGALVARPLPVPAVVGKRVVARRVAGLRTVVRCARFHAVESANVFAGLYGGEDAAFWLDSSSAMKSASSLSRCSSPELAAAGDGVREGKADERQREEYDSRKGRFSIMGACNGPLSELVTYDVTSNSIAVSNSCGDVRTVRERTIFDYLEASLKARYAPQHPDLPIEMNGGYVGFFGYELKADVGGVRGNKHKSDLPDAWFIFADRLLVLDHEEDVVFMVAVVREESEHDEVGALRWFAEVSHALDRINEQDAQIGVSEVFSGQAPGFGPGGRPVLKFTPERSRMSYLDDIRQCLREIKDGESYEVCLTNRLRTILPENCQTDPLQIYLALRLVNPAPYAAFLRLTKDVAVCCSSPERYLQISSVGLVESKPIKGTLPRGRSLEEDEVLRVQLQNSPKDRRENLMIVDLVRNDLSRTCIPGSVCVPKLMHVESYATVHQLVSTVTGTLTRPGDAVNCIRAAYPMGSMTGAPKVRTMEIIDRLEKSGRGIYSGSIGYLSLCGAADLNVVIRTAIVKGRQVEIGVGGAIVALSSPEEEYDEVILKGKAIMQSLALKATGRSEFLVLHQRSGESHQKYTCPSNG